MMNYLTYKINDLNSKDLQELLGANDKNLNILKELYNTDLIIRNSEVKFFSNDEELFSVLKKHLNYLHLQIIANKEIDETIIKQSYISLSNDLDVSWSSDIAGYTHSGKPIRFKTKNQFDLARSIFKNDLVFSLGPAGTGKTFIAVLIACNEFKKGNINKIILTRPAVEAGESLGFLPGDLKEKVDPYLMPLYDALYDILGEEYVEKMIEKKQIEIIPLAFMRGRTLNDAFVILDEAQNTTPGQMLMFLTRLGKNTKMVVNGDLSQIDLNMHKSSSGLKLASEKLRNIKGIDFKEFSIKDVVRNPLIEKIIESYKI